MMSVVLPIFLFAFVAVAVAAAIPLLARPSPVESSSDNDDALPRSDAGVDDDLPGDESRDRAELWEHGRVLMLIAWQMFHVVLLFLYPWAVAAGNRALRPGAFWMLTSLVAVLVITMLYGWRKGVFDLGEG